MFGGNIEHINRAVRANLAASHTIEVAEGNIEIHARLHDSGQAIFHERRLQHTRRAFADAQMTGCAAVEKPFHTRRSRRTNDR